MEIVIKAERTVGELHWKLPEVASKMFDALPQEPRAVIQEVIRSNVDLYLCAFAACFTATDPVAAMSQFNKDVDVATRRAMKNLDRRR